MPTHPRQREIRLDLTAGLIQGVGRAPFLQGPRGYAMNTRIGVGLENLQQHGRPHQLQGRFQILIGRLDKHLNGGGKHWWRCRFWRVEPWPHKIDSKTRWSESLDRLGTGGRIGRLSPEFHDALGVTQCELDQTHGGPFFHGQRRLTCREVVFDRYRMIFEKTQ